MGGLLSWAGEAAERGAQKLTGELEESSVGRGILNLQGNQEWELDLTPGGQAAHAMQLDYIKLHDQALKGETQKLGALRDWHQNNDAARNALPVKTATMGQYHVHAVATGHPIQQVTQSIVSDPENLNLTQKQMMIKNEQVARLAALPGSYGANFEHLAPILADMRRSSDPNIVMQAGRIADIVSNQVRDTKTIGNIDRSAAKYSMNKAFRSANKVYEALEERQALPFSENPTYEKPSEAERKAHRVIDTVMLPFLSIKHVGQFFNLPASSPLPAIGKALFQMDHQNMSATVDASSIVASTLWSSMYRDILGETGNVAEWTKSPTVGRILARIIHQPGFTWFRRQQLNMAATVGFHSTIQWAHDFASTGSKISEARLRELQIDPQDVIKQGGKLNEDQLTKGVYHYTNNRMFFSKGLDNSLYQNRNIFTRAGYMYHSFVSSQAAFMRRELLTYAKAGDYKGLAQFAGTMAVLFPNIAPLLAGAEKLLTTGSIKQAQDQVKQGYSRLYKPSSLPDWLENYVALISHIGAAGVYFNYINAIKGHRFASALAGPIVGAGTTDVEDIFSAVHGQNKESAEPLERDALKQLVPVAGGALAHTLLPTKTEKSGTSGSRFRNRFRLRGRRR